MQDSELPGRSTMTAGELLDDEAGGAIAAFKSENAPVSEEPPQSSGPTPVRLRLKAGS